MSLIPFLFKRFSSIEKKLVETGLARTLKSNILSIEGMPELKKGDIVNVGKDKAWVYALYHEYCLAAVFSEKSVSYSGAVSLAEETDWFIDDSSGNLNRNSLFSKAGYSFKQFLNTKPPLKHEIYCQQLLTGYQQLDICQPISLGQSVLFYGKENTGKTNLAYQIGEKFAKLPQKKVVIASPNPIKGKKILENVICYSSDSESSELSQYLLPFAALAHACALRDQGFDVLFILDDILFHSFKERSLFYTEKIINTNIGSLIFEHSKRIKENSSLTSIMVLNEDITNENHRLLTQGLAANLKSLVSQTVNFFSENSELNQKMPKLNFIQPVMTDYPYQIPIFQVLRSKLMSIFSELKEQNDTEKIREKFGFKSDPWDKYLLLDSKYYINLLCQDSQLSTIELVLFIEFVVFSIEKELISMFKIEMPVLRKEFLKFAANCSSPGIASLMKDPLKVDPITTLEDIDKNIIKHFYIEAKIQGWLKDYQDDYEDLLHSSTSSQHSTLRTDIKPEKDPASKMFLERIFKF